ncbi:MAG: hypothetical protein HY002_02495 [Candidatus Rokubacteria bacterium]|nr:hypothetical protein [Candidatus Rokubacteria bacterium]
MVGAALEALVGEDPGDDAVAAAVTTIPAAELADTLRRLAKKHGTAALPLLRRCLGARPDWAVAAAAALATLPSPEAAAALAAAEAHAPTKAVRTAVRRALYRLRQVGITPSPAPGSPRAPRYARPARPEPRQAWVSAIDGTGSRGVWLVLEGPFGERTLLSALLNDVAGVLDFAGGPTAKKRLDERLRRLRAESPLPWVEVSTAWALSLLVEASDRLSATGAPVPAELARWRALFPEPEPTAVPPIYARVAAPEVAADPSLLDRSAELLGLPELAGWFLDPPAVHAEALELLQAKESRLVVSDQVKEERRAALIDRAIDRHFGPDARRLWQRRLEEQALVLLETGRPVEAHRALAVALALADAERPARRIPFVRVLVERSLEVAGEVALGRLPADEASRAPRPPSAGARPG